MDGDFWFPLRKTAILMLASECLSTPLKISLPKNETMVNLKSATFIIIMLLHKGLTHMHSGTYIHTGLGCFLARVSL